VCELPPDGDAFGVDVVVPYTEQSLPFARRSHTSYLAARGEASTRAEKSARYLRYLAGRENATDHEAAEALGFGLSSINSIRNGLVIAGLVEKAGISVLSTYKRTTWALTAAGRSAVAA
jgi:hypothetical protein